MCGRSACTLAPGVLQQRVRAQTFEGQDRYRPSYNVGPRRYQPILVGRPTTNGSSSRHLVAMRWGLIPQWANAAGHGVREAINARSETIGEKPLFKKLVSSQRCVVVADGYYEWQNLGKSKQPYFFHAPEDETTKKATGAEACDIANTLYMAGLYDVWRDSASGEDVYTYCVITVPAAEKTKFVHDRMPAVLAPSVIDMWLSPTLSFDQVAPLLIPCEDIEFYPVNPIVGNINNDCSECLKPATAPSVHAGSPATSPTKQITNFFKPASIKVHGFYHEDVNAVEILAESSAESRLRKRKARNDQHKIKEEMNGQSVIIDLSDSEEDSHPRLKRPKVENAESEVQIID